MATLDALLAEGRTSWGELAALVAAAKGRPERLGAERLLRVAFLYRSATADLAVLRPRLPHDPRVESLARLVAAAHQLVYAESTPARRTGIVHFFSRQFWCLIRERPKPLALAAALIVIPTTLGALWGWIDPTEAARYAPGTIAAVTQHRAHGADLGIATSQQSALATSIFIHNIVVALIGFAGGLTGGLLTAYLLVMNALTLGVFTGLAVGAGSASIFAQLIVPHGLLELSCVTVAGAAGFRVAGAIISPGPRRRSVALAAEAVPALQLVAGAAAWLVVAGTIEGFVTPSGIGLGSDLAIGFGLFALFWGLVVFRGGPATSRADTPEQTPS